MGVPENDCIQFIIILIYIIGKIIKRTKLEIIVRKLKEQPLDGIDGYHESLDIGSLKL
jgi:hypothetical protein